MEFVSPVKWPNLEIEPIGFQFGLGPPSDAEPKNVELGAPRNIIQMAVCRMQGVGENERSALIPAWDHVRLDQVWSLVFGNETNAPEAFGGKVARSIERMGH